MKQKSLLLILSALLIISADLVYIHSRGGGGGGGGRGGGFGGGGRVGGGRGFSGAGASRSAGRSAVGRSVSRPASRPASSSRPNAGNRSRANQNGRNRSNRSNRSNNRNNNRNVNNNWNHGGYGYWGGGYGGWGWGAFGLGLYIPLSIAAAYNISNQGGSGDTTVINNYPPAENYDANTDDYASDKENNNGQYVPRVPEDAVFISPEMMNDPRVKEALAAMRKEQNPGEQEDHDRRSTSKALSRARFAMEAQ